MTKNILIVGVGGQGTLLASKLLGKALLGEGYDVKVSEVHGMSQRGGSVVTYVVYGERGGIFSPIICRGEADIIIAFEQLEAARWLPYLKPGGVIVANTQVIAPMPVVYGDKEYPAGLIDAIKDAGVTVLPVDALARAMAAGSARSANVALLAEAAKFMDFSPEIWEETIRETVPPKTVEENLRAFSAA